MIWLLENQHLLIGAGVVPGQLWGRVAIHPVSGAAPAGVRSP